MSLTVANTLELYYHGQTNETITIIIHINKFFDCLNTKNLNECNWKRNDNLNHYTRTENERVQYLTGEFLDYFKMWKTCVEEGNKGRYAAEPYPLRENIKNHFVLVTLSVILSERMTC